MAALRGIPKTATAIQYALSLFGRRLQLHLRPRLSKIEHVENQNPAGWIATKRAASAGPMVALRYE